ncbi:MAG: ribosome silencing factor [Planctomycetota bacterium]|nr:ribosome silencing factor [Planctomycetota bacterium]
MPLFHPDRGFGRAGGLPQRLLPIHCPALLGRSWRTCIAALVRRSPNRSERILTTRKASTPPPPSPAPIDNAGRTPSAKAKKLALDIAGFLGANQTEDLAILDVAGPIAIVDYFVIGTVRSTRQAQAVARELDQEVKDVRGKRKRNQAGMESDESNWVLLDFDDVVVHLLLPEARAYYDLESLWADVPRLAVPPPTEGKQRTTAERRSKHIQIFPSEPGS